MAKQAPQVYRPGPLAPVLREVGWPSQTWDTPMQEALVVRREAHIPAPPAAVFAFLTDQEKLLRWMGTEAQVEPRSGGIYYY
jgi:activator of Hsp90 ATPase-like protein